MNTTRRFEGEVEALTHVFIAELAHWIADIDLADWPQQERGEIKPAMVTDPAWHGFGARSQPVITELMAHFPGCSSYQHMLSAVMPQNSILAHRDQQRPEWLCRVHVPLISNDQSVFIVGGRVHHMDVGVAYRVNTLAEHAVINNGTLPRIHFMFDVRM